MTSYLKQFLQNPKTTGAIAESSKELAQLIVKMSNIKAASTIVEFGPGAGIFTKEIIKNIDHKKTFFAIELNKDFIIQLREKLPDATVYHDSVVNIKKYLRIHDLESCDCIISGLPWASFKISEQKEMINKTVQALSSNGEFLTFMYLHATIFPSAQRFKMLLEKKFSSVKKSAIVWKNLPPAFVYHCKKSRI